MAKLAIFLQFDPPGIIFLIFSGGIIPVFAFRAGQSHTNAHPRHLLKLKSLFPKIALYNLTQFPDNVNT